MRPANVSARALGLALLRLGAFAFSVIGSTLALLRSDFGARRGWIPDQDVAEALAITQTLLGKPGVQVVAFLGWKLTLVTLMMASFAGSLAGLLLIVSGRGGMKYALPFGTFLAMGAALAATDGPGVLEWYLRFYQ